jgi:hypothetical protein
VVVLLRDDDEADQAAGAERLVWTYYLVDTVCGGLGHDRHGWPKERAMTQPVVVAHFRHHHRHVTVFQIIFICMMCLVVIVVRRAFFPWFTTMTRNLRLVP